MFDLTGKRYLITGAASGLGRATSILLCQYGASVLLLDNDLSGLEVTCDRCEGRSSLLLLDLMESKDIAKRICSSVDSFGRLNGFVHFAGKSYLRTLRTINMQSAIEILQLNALSALELSKIFVRKDVRSGSEDSIVFISSVYGSVGSAANSVYSMSKSALHGLTRSLAIELSSLKIRVNCVAPGFVNTHMLSDLSRSFDEDYLNLIADLHPLGVGEPKDVANAVVFLLSEMSSWITGVVLPVDGGFTAQ